MEFIIGGACQGKLDYALNYSGWPKEAVATARLENKPVINRLHLWIRHCLLAGEAPLEELITFLDHHPDVIILCDEVGSGIVPLEKFERHYREEVGRIGCLLAGKARRVHRVHCGIGRIIKDE